MTNTSNKPEKKGWFAFRKGKSKDVPRDKGEVPRDIPPRAPIPQLKSPPRLLEKVSLMSPSEASKVSALVGPKHTSPLQSQLWLGAVMNTIQRVEQQQDKVPPSPIPNSPAGTPAATPAAVEAHHPASNYYQNAQEYGVYVDYSTFDDGESISSIDLLFRWLTCRDLDVARTKSLPTRNPEGMMLDDGHEVIDSDVSFDADAQPRRRILFSP